MPKSESENQEEELQVFPREEREELLEYLTQHEDEINLHAVCKELEVDYAGQFLPAVHSISSFRNAIVNHLEQIKFSIISSISNKVSGKDKSALPLAHAKFLLDLIESQAILPSLKTIAEKGGGEKPSFEISKSLQRRLKMNNSVNNEHVMDRLNRKDPTAVQEEKIEDSIEEEAEDEEAPPPEPVIPTKTNDEKLKEARALNARLQEKRLIASWDLPDKF